MVSPEFAEFKEFIGPYHFAKLLYMDGDSVFLKEPFWYSHRIYEIKRSYINAFVYSTYNPVDIGQRERVKRESDKQSSTKPSEFRGHH